MGKKLKIDKHCAEALIEDGVIVIRLPVDNLPAVIEGSWASGGIDTRWQISDNDAFAKDLVRALNYEDEAGNTMIHRMFDQGIEEAIEAGAEGIDEHPNQNA